MSEIRILIVGSGPVSLDMCPAIHLDDIAEKCPKYFYDFIVDNNFFCKCSEMIWMDDLPEDFYKYFLGGIKRHDLDKNRDVIKQKVLEYFPSTKKITYATVDPYILWPDYCGLTDKVNAIDAKFSKKLGIRFKFQKHYKCKFQEYIRAYDHTYDIVWFMGCCNPDYVIDCESDYLVNFRKILNDDGLIFYTDPVDGPILGFIGFDERVKKMADKSAINKKEKAEKMRKVKYLLKEFVEVEQGVYQFE